MAADPELAKSGQYIPKTDAVLFHTKMVSPIAGETLRFLAPKPRARTPTSAPSQPLDHHESVMVVKWIYFTSAVAGA